MVTILYCNKSSTPDHNELCNRAIKFVMIKSHQTSQQHIQIPFISSAKKLNCYCVVTINEFL